MRKAVFIVIFSAVFFVGKAQQIAMYNHYFYKPLFYNPAFAGSGSKAEAMVLNRSQWVGFTNAPQLNFLLLDGIIKQDKMGLALNIMSDRRGISKRMGGNVAYSYRANFGENTHLKMGVSLGFIDQSIDYSKAISESANDPVLFSEVQQKMIMDGNAGLAFAWKKLELAASVPQLFGNRVNFVDNTTSIRSYYQQVRHYLVSAKYEIELSKKHGVNLTPQLFTRIIPNTPIQFDGNINLRWQNHGWIGVTYKSNYANSLNIGITLNKCVDIGYSYEFIMGDLKKYSGLSHEIMVNYKFGVVELNNETKVTDASPANSASEEYEHKLDSLHTELKENQRKLEDKEKKIKELNDKLERLAALQKAQKNSVNGKENNSGTAPNEPNTNTQNNQKTVDGGVGNTPIGTKASTSTTTNNSNSVVTSNNTKVTSQTNIDVQTTPKKVDKIIENPPQIAKSDAPMSSTKEIPMDQSSKKVMEEGVWIITSNAIDYKNANATVPNKGFYIIAGTFFYQDFAISEVNRFKEKGFVGCNWMYSNSKQFNYVYIKRVNTKAEAILEAKNLQIKGVKDAWIKVLE